MRSVFAPCATASPPWFVPVVVTLAEPVNVVVGYVPRSPLTVVGPVLVMPAPARTAKLSAVPSETAVAAAEAPATRVSRIPSRTAASGTIAHRFGGRERLVRDEDFGVERVIFDLRSCELRWPTG